MGSSVRKLGGRLFLMRPVVDSRFSNKGPQIDLSILDFIFSFGTVIKYPVPKNTKNQVINFSHSRFSVLFFGWPHQSLHSCASYVVKLVL